MDRDDAFVEAEGDILRDCDDVSVVEPDFGVSLDCRRRVRVVAHDGVRRQ